MSKSSAREKIILYESSALDCNKKINGSSENSNKRFDDEDVIGKKIK